MWDVSNVTNMKYMFYNASSFNQDLIGWDVSSVTTMAYMFGFPNYSTYGISVFNGDISSWDVSNVTDMEGMFIYALDYNRDLSNWNVSNVTNMSKMFKQAFDFNQDIYGKHLRVALVGFIRPEVKFDGIGELKAQITSDTRLAKKILSGKPPEFR